MSTLNMSLFYPNSFLLFNFSFTTMAYWSRTILLPASLDWACKWLSNSVTVTCQMPMLPEMLPIPSGARFSTLWTPTLSSSLFLSNIQAMWATPDLKLIYSTRYSNKYINKYYISIINIYLRFSLLFKFNEKVSECWPSTYCWLQSL